MDEQTKLLRNCTICKHEKIDDVEMEFLAEHITSEEAAASLNCTLGQFKRHIEMHLKKDIALHLSANAPILAKRIFDKTNQLIESCDRNLKLISEVRAEWKDHKKSEWITALVKLETLVATNIEKMSKITGELRESSTMKVEQMNIQINNMTEEMISEMCTPCKTKLAPKLLKTVGLDNVKSDHGD